MRPRLTCFAVRIGLEIRDSRAFDRLSRTAPVQSGPQVGFLRDGAAIARVGGSIFQMSLRLHGSPTGRAQRMQEGSWRMRGIGGWGAPAKKEVDDRRRVSGGKRRITSCAFAPTPPTALTPPTSRRRWGRRGGRSWRSRWTSGRSPCACGASWECAPSGRAWSRPWRTRRSKA